MMPLNQHWQGPRQRKWQQKDRRCMCTSASPFEEGRDWEEQGGQVEVGARKERRAQSTGETERMRHQRRESGQQLAFCYT